MPPQPSDITDGLITPTSSPLFAGAPQPLLRAMMSGCETRELRAGERLLAAGDQNDTLYLVLSGTLNVHLPETERRVVQIASGECVGELSLLDGFQVSADVHAEEQSLLLAIECEHLWRFMEQAPVVARNLLRMLAARVRNDDRMLKEADQMRRQYEHAATVDALTGLRNRRWLNESFGRQLERSMRAGRCASLLMIDADHFKRVNDSHGHRVGDEVLVHLGRTLAAGLRPQDLLARYGGEEFAALLPDVARPDALVAAERLRKSVEREPPTTAAGLLRGITISIGVATALPDVPPGLDALLDHADRALSDAKQTGRNRVRG